MDDDNRIDRRQLLQVGSLGLLSLNWLPGRLSPSAEGGDSQGKFLDEPLEIGGDPQFLFDLHVVDNHWPLKRNAEPVRLAFHQPQKHPANPLLHGPGRGGYLYALREPGGPFRMYYQASAGREAAEAGMGKTGTAYAESDDGLRWNLPKLSLYEFAGSKTNNIVWMGSRLRAAGTQILELPDEARRGHRYVMFSQRRRLGIGWIVGRHPLGRQKRRRHQTENAQRHVQHHCL